MLPACTIISVVSTTLQDYLYYSVIKKNEILIHAETWTNLKNTMINEKSHAQKTIYKKCLEKANIRKKYVSGCLELGVETGINVSRYQGSY